MNSPPPSKLDQVYAAADALANQADTMASERAAAAIRIWRLRRELQARSGTMISHLKPLLARLAP